jgi:hypothetical protein
MGTSGLASGAKEIFEFFTRELGKRNIGGTVIKTGDMGYCFAEPTIEVTRPDEEPVVFGNVLFDDPMEIYRSQTFVSFRNKHRLAEDLPEVCLNCIDAYGLMCSNRTVYS